MKCILLLLGFFYLANTASYSQNSVGIFSNHSSDPFIYNTYYNPVQVFVEKSPCNDVELKSEDVFIKKDSECIFYVRSKPFISYARFFVYNNTDLIDSFRMDVNNDIPLPIIKRSGKEMEHESNNLTFDSLICVLPFRDKYNGNVSFTVVSYIVQLVRDNRIYFNEHVTGNKFSKLFQEAILKMKLTDKVILRSISLKSNDGYYYCVPYREFTFK